MTTTATEPAEILLQLILDADVLNDEQKDLYASELLEGRLHPELMTNLDTIIERSIQTSTQDAESIQADLAAIDSALAEAKREEESSNAELVREYETEVETVVSDHKQGCATIEREFDKGIETLVKKEETGEQDAIRAFLKEEDQSKPAA